MTTPAALPHDDTGTGAPLLLLHAFALDARMWAPQRAALSQSHRLITPDLAGFGRARALLPHTSLDAHARDIAALLDALGITRVTLGGLSMGGYIALAFARLSPERLAGLILADTRAATDTAEGKAGRARSIAQVEAEGVPALIDALLPRLLSERATPEVQAQVRQIACEQTPAAVIAALAAMRDRQDASPLLAHIAVPALVVVGSADVMTPPAEAQQMAAALPRAAIAVIEGAGHLASLEAPDAFNAALLGWLAQRTG